MNGKLKFGVYRSDSPKIKIGVYRSDSSANMPIFKTKGDSCADVYVLESATIKPNSKFVFKTGLHVNLPDGIGIHVRPRSSIFSKGLIINGTIDNGYVGEIKIVVWNVSNDVIHVEKNTRVGQLFFETPINSIEFYDITKPELKTTERQDGGFGHTGNN